MVANSLLIFMQVALKTQVLIDSMLKSARSGGISVKVNDISDELSLLLNMLILPLKEK